MSLLIKNGHIVDPVNKLDGVADILIDGEKISRIGKNISAKGATIIEAKGKLVLPGLVDMHAHLREPGREDRETILTGSQAAARGGFTAVACMPNTAPCIDNQGTAEFVIKEGKKAAIVDVRPIGAITKNREGKELAEVADLKRAGCVAISDDGNPVENSDVMRRAMEYASMFGMLIISHSEDRALSLDGVMNEGLTSTVLGLRPIPAAAEYSAVSRDLRLAELAGSRIHIAHVSTKESVGIIRHAKKKGVLVTCETCPHYFTLTDEAVKEFDSNTKVNPPLRKEEDVKAIIEGLRDGTIDAIATDHAPHTDNEKDVEFDLAPFGMVGLETALSLAVSELINKKILSWPELIEKMSVAPARILGIEGGTLTQGSPANVVIFDKAVEWEVKKEELLSKGKNTPFLGQKLPGKVLCTIFNGKVVYKT